MVGPGRPIDTDRFFVICANVGLRRLHGNDRPGVDQSRNGRRLWPRPSKLVTIADMVRAQAMLIDYLGIETLFCVAGGSMGGMQVLQWAASYPDRVFAALPIATSAKHSSQNIAFHEVGRQAIMADPEWRNGRHLAEGVNPFQRAGRRAHGRSHHLSLGFGAAETVRAQIAGSRRAYFFVRRGFSDRVLPAPSRFDIRGAIRPQFLSVHDACNGLFRPRRRLRRIARARFHQFTDTVLRGVLHFGLAVSDQRSGGRWSMRSPTQAARLCPLSKSTQTEATTRFS